MVGTIPVKGDMSMNDLAAALTRKEQDFAQLTGLSIDPNPGANRNLATFVSQENQLGALAICGGGELSQGIKVLSTTAYINGAQTKIDVYRLPLS
jgi:hypothetical protein